MTVRFGTDGLRGRAGVAPIRPEEASQVGRAAARWAATHGDDKVLVAHDPRPSSNELETAVVRGICSAGATAVRLGCVPTPVLGVALAAGHGPVGVMVTASHNPAPDNGFKVIGPGGRKPLADEVAKLEAWMGEEVHGGEQGAQRDGRAAAMLAWDAAVEALDLVLPTRALVVDLANGAATAMAQRLKVIWPGELHLVATGTGLVNDGVGSEHLEHLGGVVRDRGAWAGLAVDGDGDRCRLVDGSGAPIPGDAVTWLLTGAMRAKGLAVTVMSTLALEAQLDGVQVVRTPVGDKHLMAAMVEHQLDLGAEESGHVLFADFPAGDGLVAGLRALAAIGERSVSEAFGAFRPYPRKLGKVRVTARPPLADVPAVAQACQAMEAQMGSTGRVFLRYSGTEPVLRILVEAPDVAQVERAYDHVHAAVVGALT